MGDDVEVKVLRVDTKDRKVGLSMKNVDDPVVPDEVQDMPMDITNPPATPTATPAAAAATPATAPAPSPAKSAKEKEKEKKDLRGGTGVAGPLFQMPAGEEAP